MVVKQVVQQLGIAESGYKVVINNGHDGGQAVPHYTCSAAGGKK